MRLDHCTLVLLSQKEGTEVFARWGGALWFKVTVPPLKLPDEKGRIGDLRDLGRLAKISYSFTEEEETILLKAFDLLQDDWHSSVLAKCGPLALTPPAALEELSEQKSQQVGANYD